MIIKVHQYLNIILKRIWLIILIPICAAGVSFAAGIFIQKPIYESSATVYIMYDTIGKGQQLTDLQLEQQAIRDFREIIKSRSVSGALVKELGINEVVPQKLASKISIKLKGETRVIQIRARYGSPVGAQKLAEKVCSLFIHRMEEMIGEGGIELLDAADVPFYPSSPKPVINMVIAFLTGFFAATGAVILLEYMDDSIKTVEDIENCVGIEVLGTIPILEMK